jgi:hypothetical protein
MPTTLVASTVILRFVGTHRTGRVLLKLAHKTLCVVVHKVPIPLLSPLVKFTPVFRRERAFRMTEESNP